LTDYDLKEVSKLSIFPKVPLNLEAPLDDVVERSLVGILKDVFLVYSSTLGVGSFTGSFSGDCITKNLSATVGTYY
jgi:hypothetical protein